MTATQWLEVVSSYSLQLIIVICIGRLLERRIKDSSVRCFIWNSCFIAILMLGLSSLLFPRLHIFQPWSSLAPHELLSISCIQREVARVLLLVWGFDVAVATLKWIATVLWLRRILSRYQQLDGDKVRTLLKELNVSSNNLELPRIFISRDNTGPCCWQLHRPTIFLPAFILDGHQDDLRHVLKHELEHLRTNHPLHLFLQQLVQIICWFHPAVYSAACRASLAREYLCDDAAIDRDPNAAAYLRTLLRIAERQCDANRLRQAMGFTRSRSEIILRARRLLCVSHDRICRRGRSRLLVIVVLILTTCALSQVWIPSDSMSSSRSKWSPWPTWTAHTLHVFGLNVRDYEQFDRRVQAYELRYEQGVN